MTSRVTPKALRQVSSSPNRDRGTAVSNTEVLKFQELAIYAAIFVATAIAYWPGVHGGPVWDDSAHVTPRALQSWHGLWRIWFELGASQQYYPLLHSAFWIEHRFWGDAVLGYHLTNVFQHALCACLVVMIVRFLKLPGAWLAGFVFALHPVCVEAVAWISEQKDTLSGVFYLASALMYLNFDRSRRRSQYAGAMALFLFALMSKSVTATLPAALLVVFWWLRGRLDWRRDVLPLLPWFVIGASGGLFTAWVEATYIGASGAGYQLSFVQHILLAGRVICFYAWKIVWPADLVFSYPHWNIDGRVWWQYLYPVAVIVVSAWLLMLAVRKESPRRGPLAGFLFFAGTLFPVLGFLHVFPFKYSYVADHFQYLASLGIIVPAAWVLTKGIPGISESGRNAIGVALIAILAVLTWRQASLYRDPETLYRATLERNPESWMTHNNLGIYLTTLPGRMDDAATEFQAAIRIRPDHTKAHMNLGNLWLQTPGKLPEAIAEYQAALQLEPNYAPAHDNLGIALMQMPGRLPDAIAEFETALRLRPNDSRSHELLGLAFAQMPDKLNDAVSEYEEALRIQPDDATIHMNFGDALAKIPERHDEAIAQYRLALQNRTDADTRKQAIEGLRSLGAEP